MVIEEKIITKTVEVLPNLNLTFDLKLTKNTDTGLVKIQLLKSKKLLQPITLVSTLKGTLDKNNTWQFKADTTPGQKIYNKN